MMVEVPSTSSAMPSTSRDTNQGEVPRKRRMEDQGSAAVKRMCRWYYRLESDTSVRTSEEDSESVYSIQGHETGELVQDTPDTESNSEESGSDYDVELEYEVASLSEHENPFLEGDGSSSGSDDMLAAAGAIAAVICDTSLEAWLTDGEDSDNSSVGETELGRRDFWTCIQCKSRNNNPLYRYCQKCFQMRKSLFPPRPRGHRKRRRRSIKTKAKQVQPTPNPSVSSQDSGIGSSQDLTPVEIDVPNKPTTENDNEIRIQGTKRTSSSIIGGDVEEVNPKRIKIEKDNADIINSCENTKVDSEVNRTDCVIDSEETTQTKNQQKVVDESSEEIRNPLPERKELCIICNVKSKDSIFLHGKIAHMCCCYKCAMKSWSATKRCPVCNNKVNNIVKVF